MEVLTHYQRTNFRLFQTGRVCRRQFQIDENGRKVSKRVGNTVGKGEIARYEQFLLFPQCFQKACFPGASKGVKREWVKEDALKQLWEQRKPAFILIQQDFLPFPKQVLLLLSAKELRFFSMIMINPLPDNKILDWSKFKNNLQTTF